ncbi:MAG: CPBP family intramembrane glutamic endopeptidase, partial [Candidatus Eiseniibacteriota bacterium]
MPGPADHFFVALLVLLLPPRAYVSFRALKLASPEQQPQLRRRIYIAAAISQWILCGLLALNWAHLRRPWAQLGLVPVLTPGMIGVTIGLAIVLVTMITRWRAGGQQAAIDRARVRFAFAEPMMPHTRGELGLFRALSVTAGVCEEFLFRGFLIWYLGRYTGVIQAALLSSLAFGIGHAYQGPRGIGVTALIGAFMSGVYLLTGSLFLSMIINALMD